MQIKEKCINCIKAVVCGWDPCGKPRFGCQNAFCIFDLIVENPFRDELVEELNKNVRKNS